MVIAETSGVIQSKVAELRRRKEYQEGRDLPLRTIAAETGLAIGTVQRLMKGDTERVYLSTLNTLCAYFKVSQISELIEYVPETATDQPVVAGDEKPSA